MHALYLFNILTHSLQEEDSKKKENKGMEMVADSPLS